MAIRRTNKSLVQRLGGDSIFGTGLDGSVTIANGTTTYLTRDMYYSSLTVNSGGTLFTNGFRVFVQGTLTNNGTIGFPAATAANVSDGSGTIAGRQSSLNPANAWGVSTGAVSSSALNDLDDALAGWFITANGTQTKIGSGSLGVTGNAGAIATNAGAGGAGELRGRRAVRGGRPASAQGRRMTAHSLSRRAWRHPGRTRACGRAVRACAVHAMRRVGARHAGRVSCGVRRCTA